MNQVPSTGLTCVVSDGVADVRLNRPEVMNAVDDQMFMDLIRMGARLRGDLSVRAVVLSGEGKSFCAGLDLASFKTMRASGPSAGGGAWRPEDADEQAAALADVHGLRLGRSQRSVLIWQTIPVPVIAAVHGAAVGFGLQLALGADIRIVSPEVRFGVYEGNWGLAPDSAGSQLLPELVGRDIALELCLTSRDVSGEEAVRIGLATRMEQRPVEAALELARLIAARSPGAIRSSTRLIRDAGRTSFQEGLIAERDEMKRNVGSHNQREAVAARVDRRDANFVDE